MAEIMETFKGREDIEKTAARIPHAEKLRGRAVLLTGATGLIGSAVAEILFFLNAKKNAGIRIYLAGRSEERLRKRFPQGGYRFVSYDALDENIQIEEADFICFLQRSVREKIGK